MKKKTPPPVHHIANGKCSKALRQADVSPHQSGPFQINTDAPTSRRPRRGALLMANMLLLRWKTFSGSFKVVYRDVTQRFTHVKMLYCYLVLQDWSVWIEKPFVLCCGVIFFSLSSRPEDHEHLQESSFSGKCLAKSLSDFGPLLCLTYSLVAMSMLLLPQWLQMPEKVCSCHGALHSD